MIHCSKCNINWAKLWSGDDEVEFCPECGNDQFLEEVQDFVGYIKCPITGHRVNAVTGVRLEHDHPAEISKPKIRVVVGKPVKETIEEREERELAGILAYQASGNPKDYHLTIKKLNNGTWQ
jgi:hypothetical protein